MDETELISAALRFNERINVRNLTGLGEMMTEDHVFIDIRGEVYEGRVYDDKEEVRKELEID
ncbi:MAG: hypothetical protein ACFFDD_15890 [Promethearchaeota archaeon]